LIRSQLFIDFIDTSEKNFFLLQDADPFIYRELGFFLGQIENCLEKAFFLFQPESPNPVDGVEAGSHEAEAPRAPSASLADSGADVEAEAGAALEATSPSGAPIRAEAEPEHAHHLIRSREVSPGPSIRGIVAAYRETGRDQFTLPLFDGDSVTMTIVGAQEHKIGGSVVSGHVAGLPSSQVILAEKDGAISGSIRWPDQNRVYEVRPLAGGGIQIGEVDLDALGSCGVAAHQVVSNQARLEQPQSK